MKFRKPDVTNAAAELSDMRAEVRQNDDGSASLLLFLTFGYAELPLDDRYIKVSAKEAMIRVTCEGIEIDPAGKFGELVRPNSLKTSVTREVTSKTQVHAGAEVTIEANAVAPTAKASASAGGKREAQESAVGVTSSETESLRVEALGGDRWRIREFEDPKQLHGRYLGQEALCTVRSVGRANRQRIEVSVEIKQKDLVFDPKPDGLLANLSRSTNRDKLTKILMAKSLHEAMETDRHFDGVLVASLGVCDSDAD